VEKNVLLDSKCGITVLETAVFDFSNCNRVSNYEETAIFRSTVYIYFVIFCDRKQNSNLDTKVSYLFDGRI
jgi:hypothetical protein